MEVLLNPITLGSMSTEKNRHDEEKELISEQEAEFWIRCLESFSAGVSFNV